VKQCPYCAEEIRDEAIVCRWCGRPWIIGAQKVSYLRAAWTLGVADLIDGGEAYAIWNNVSGGQPIETFTHDNRGWHRAWSRYQTAEAKASNPSGTGWLVGGFIEFPIG
jgi:hypothetical protein